MDLKYLHPTNYKIRVTSTSASKFTCLVELNTSSKSSESFTGYIRGEILGNYQAKNYFNIILALHTIKNIKGVTAHLMF